MFIKLHVWLWARIHFVQAYLAYHRQDWLECHHHEAMMREYERQLDVFELNRRMAK